VIQAGSADAAFAKIQATQDQSSNGINNLSVLAGGNNASAQLRGAYQSFGAIYGAVNVTGGSGSNAAWWTGGGGVLGRALGGPVTAGGSYWVGERGPELFKPAQSGSIIPNSSFRASSPTINVTVTGGSNPAETKRLVHQGIMEALPAITDASVGKTMRRLGRPHIN